MSAKTKWWLCGACGFSNRPRGTRQNSISILPATELQADNTKCEQCGGEQAEKDAVDYAPQGGR